MLKENEKRTFWLVVMAIAAVSLVSGWAASFIVSLDGLIDADADFLGTAAYYDFSFSIAFMLLVFFVVVAAAVIHLSTKGRNCLKAKIVWAAVIGGYFLLSSIIFTICFYEVEDVSDSTTYAALMSYLTTTLTIALSYEIAFLAQMMLGRKPKQAETAEVAETAKTESGDK